MHPMNSMNATSSGLQNGRPSAEFDLNIVEITSPCDRDWNKMTGDDQIRFCGDCKKNVYNISEYSKREAKELIEQHEGQVCLRLYRRADGTVVTSDCSLLQVASRWSRIGLLASIGVLLLILSGGGMAMANIDAWKNSQWFHQGPLSQLQHWGSPPMQCHHGDMSCPPRPAAVPTKSVKWFGIRWQSNAGTNQ